MANFKLTLIGTFLIAVLACSLSPQVKVFENDAFAFSIPQGWKWGAGNIDHIGTDFQEIVGIRNPEGLLPAANFTVATAPQTGEKSLESWLTQAFEGQNLIEEVSKQAFKKGELSGCEIYYTHPTGEAWFKYRDIWMEKGANIYVLSFRASRNLFNNYSDTFDHILDSFSFKD
jgi:hypothetical protein